MSLLIIDDSARMRDTIRSLLSGREYDVAEACDGLAGVAAFDLTRPDYVLMDVSMPRLDGITATKRIRVLDPKAKVIVVTDYRDEELRNAAAAAGAIDYVTKDDLFRLLEILP
jgi:CheY-like chemotaxis protein